MSSSASTKTVYTYVSVIRIIFILTVVAYMTSVTLTDEREKND